MIWVSLKKKKEMKKTSRFKNTCYELLINYIPERIRKSVH